jgi:hypothetical protein
MLHRVSAQSSLRCQRADLYLPAGNVSQPKLAADYLHGTSLITRLHIPAIQKSLDLLTNLSFI